MYKVLFVTFYYNRASEVKLTLDSMVKAKVDRTHVVAVNDGSMDNTLDVLLDYKNKNNDIEIISQKNTGFSKCIASILEDVNTEYIAICGSGDICHKERLKRQVELMDRMPDVVFCGTASRNIDINTNKVIDLQEFSEGEIYAKDLLNAPPFTHGTVMIRASAYKKVGGYDPNFIFSQDWDLWFRLLSIGKGYFINEQLYDRRLLLDGASFNAKKAEIQLFFKYLAIYFNNNKTVDRNNYLKNLDFNKIKKDLNLEDKIKKDLASRYVKLISIKDFSGAKEILNIINNQYGGIGLFYLFIGQIVFISAKYNLGYRYLSWALRKGVDLARSKP